MCVFTEIQNQLLSRFTIFLSLFNLYSNINAIQVKYHVKATSIQDINHTYSKLLLYVVFYYVLVHLQNYYVPWGDQRLVEYYILPKRI